MERPVTGGIPVEKVLGRRCVGTSPTRVNPSPALEQLRVLSPTDGTEPSMASERSKTAILGREAAADEDSHALRIGRAVLALSGLSAEGYVLIRRGRRDGDGKMEWRTTFRTPLPRYGDTVTRDARSLAECLDRAVIRAQL